MRCVIRTLLNRPRLVGAAAAAVSRVGSALVQCDADCAADRSVAVADRLRALVWPPADPSHVAALLALHTQCCHLTQCQYTVPILQVAVHFVHTLVRMQEPSSLFKQANCLGM